MPSVPARTRPSSGPSSVPWRCCREGSGYVARPNPWTLACADGDRLSGPGHAVEHVDRDGDPSSLAWQGPGTKLGADQMLVSAHGGLGVVAAPIAGRPLPSDAASLGHGLNVAVTRALSFRIVRAQHRRGAGGMITFGGDWRCRSTAGITPPPSPPCTKAIRRC